MSAPSGRLFRLCQKELRETLRDRRTIITLVLMPLLVYPVLSMTLNRFLLASGVDGEPRFVVCMAAGGEADFLLTILQDPRSQPPPSIVAAAGEEVAKFEFVAPPDGMTPLEALENDLVDAVISRSVSPQPTLTITALNENPTSLAARRILAERLLYFNQALFRDQLIRVGQFDVPSIAVEVDSIGESQSQPLLATIVPLVLVLMTITGAVYPAIDLTAGERERGTMEALIASPIPRGMVLFSKYVAVVTVALLTAVANLGAMFVTLWAGRLLPLLVGEDAGFPLLAFLQIFLLLILFAAFFSAVLLALTSFARSFKEAQAYLIPLMLLSLTPGVLSLFPDVRLTPSLSVVPLLNIILLSREILAGTIQFVPAMVAVCTTLVYAAAALGVAARLFGSDAVLRGSEVSFGAALKRPETGRSIPALSEAAMTLALIFPTYFLASNILAQWATQAIAPRLLLNAGVLFAVFGGLPLFAVWYCRDRPQTTYRLARPGLLAICGAVLLGLGLWTWAHELFVFAELLGLGGLDASKIAGVEAMLAEMRNISPALVLLTLALTPAVVEELCFRGYLFSTLAARLSPTATIVVTSLLFGLFHVLTGSTLLLERFLPTTMLGLVLGTVAWRTGSVWPGIILHFTHNAFLELVMCYRDQLLELGIGIEEQTHLPWTWLLGGTLLIGVGAAMVGFARPRPAATSLPESPVREALV